MQVGKGQCQHYHDQAAHGIKDFFPELNFVFLCRLPVGVQVVHVLEQTDSAHALRAQNRSSHHFRADLRGPAEGLHVCAVHPCAFAVSRFEFSPVHCVDQPVIVPAEACGLALRHRDQQALVIKFKYANIAHAGITGQRAHIDGVIAIGLFLLEPCARLAYRDLALKLRFE